MPGEQSQFYTLQTMMTLTGATGATFVIANGVQKAFDVNPRWLALAIAEVVSLAGAYFTNGQGSDYFVAVVNGFLIYCTAAGATAAIGSPGSLAARGPGTAPRRRFLTSWF